MNEHACSIDGCDNPARSGVADYCEKHYYRVRRHGIPEVKLPSAVPESFEDVFARLVPVEEPEACWEWKGSINERGYGTVGTKKEYAHRFIYRHMVGEIPARHVVRHFVCDNPPCVNPAHLRVGTQQDNVDDATSKSRHAFGERLPQAKMTESDVICVRLQRRHSGISYAALGKQFGMTSQSMSRVVRAVAWAHIPLDAEPTCACHGQEEP